MEVEQISDLSEEELAKIALAFEYFTSKEVVVDPQNGTSVIGALTGLEEVKMFMFKLAKMYDLQGEIRDIFACLLVDELLKFQMESLLVYMQFMNEEVPLELLAKEDKFGIAVLIHNFHVRRLQRYRVQKYITYLFFGTPDIRELVRPEVLHMLDDSTADLIMEGDENLTPEEILNRGPNFYFLRVGELTLDRVMSRYTYSEALHLYMTVTKPDPEGLNRRIVTNETTFEELCMYLIESWQDLNLDPRTWVTVEGPMFPLLYEANEEPTSINQDQILEPERIVLACEMEGIPTSRKPYNLLLEEYTMSQLSPAFSGSHGEHRDRYGACYYDDTHTGIHLDQLEEEEVVYYGLRDGTSPMVIYTIQELYDTFKNPEETQDESGTGYCFDPWSISENGDNFILWKSFPLHVIRRLMMNVLPSKRNCIWTQPLIKACREILQKKMDVPNGMLIQNSAYLDIKMLHEKEPAKVLNVLLTMFNSGIQLSRYTEEFDTFDETALSVLMTGDPWRILPEPRFTGRPQAESQRLILNITEAIMELGDSAPMFKFLHVVKYYDKSFHFNFDNDGYELGNYLLLMHQFSRLSLTTSLILSGGWMMATACYYHYKLTGRWLNELQLEGDFE